MVVIVMGRKRSKGRRRRRAATPGSGLAASLIAAVARLHGLDLRVESADRGCRATLSAATAPLTAAARPDAASGGAAVSVS